MLVVLPVVDITASYPLLAHCLGRNLATATDVPDAQRRKAFFTICSAFAQLCRVGMSRRLCETEVFAVSSWRQRRSSRASGAWSAPCSRWSVHSSSSTSPCRQLGSAPHLRCAWRGAFAKRLFARGRTFQVQSSGRQTLYTLPSEECIQHSKTALNTASAPRILVR